MYISFINFTLGRNIGPSSLIFFNVKIIFWKKECQIYICKLLNFLPATRCLATVVCEDKMSAPSPADSSICQMSEVHAFTSRGFFRRWTWRFHDHFCHRMGFTIEWTLMEPLYGYLVILFIANRFVLGCETRWNIVSLTSKNKWNFKYFYLFIRDCMWIAPSLFS